MCLSLIRISVNTQQLSLTAPVKLAPIDIEWRIIISTLHVSISFLFGYLILLGLLWMHRKRALCDTFTSEQPSGGFVSWM